MSMLYLKKVQKRKNNDVSSSEDSDSECEAPKIKTNKASSLPDTEKEQFDDMSDMFVIDRNSASATANNQSDLLVGDLLNESHLPPYEMDKDLKALLDKAVVGPKFENNHQPQKRLLGRNAQARLRKAEREKTKGSNWFNLPATELTEENKRDLELLQMRNVLDPLAHYKRNDRAVLPKYFQVGKVVDAPEDFYSSRMLKKERKKTMVDEILYHEESLTKARKRYDEINKKEQKKRRGAFQRMGNKKSHKQQRDAKLRKKK